MDHNTGHKEVKKRRDRRQEAIYTYIGLNEILRKSENRENVNQRVPELGRHWTIFFLFRKNKNAIWKGTVDLVFKSKK